MYKTLTLHIDGVLTEQVETPRIAEAHVQLIAQYIPRWRAEDSKPRTYFPARFKYTGWRRLWHSSVSRNHYWKRT